MRFDDMLATALSQPQATAAARVAVWRQLVDLLAQRRSSDDSETTDRAYAVLRRLRPEVPRTIRAEAVHAISGRRLPPRLVGYFADEPVSLSAPLMSSARLDAAQWVELLPAMPPSARAILRNRRDLDPEVSHALGSFGASDLVIGAAAPQREPEIVESVPDGLIAAVRAPAAVTAAAPDPVPEPAGAVPDWLASVALQPEPPPVVAERPRDPALERGEAQIRELVARIEAFRQSGGVRPVGTPSVSPDQPAGPAGGWARLEAFRWETGAEGMIRWVDGAPREPLIGQSIAAAAAGGDAGVDAQAAGAFARRAPFRDARLSLAGAGEAAGDWRISGVPFFAAGDGRFLGYRGTARRPRLDETAPPVAADAGGGLYGTGLPSDALRQLAHELRTPLNAIIGFAEMIERQLLGPAAAGYRDRAQAIMTQAGRLLGAVDDLDTAARLETSRLALAHVALDPAAVLRRLGADYAALARERGARLDIEIAADLPPADGDVATVERMVARLLASTIGLSRPGEAVLARLARDPIDPNMLRFSVAKPEALADRDEVALLDPGFVIEGDWPDAPALGLGFSLRLVRHLAHAAGGGFDIGPRAFILRLPVRRDHAASGGQGG